MRQTLETDSANGIISILSVMTILSCTLTASAQDTAARVVLMPPVNAMPPEMLTGPMRSSVLKSTIEVQPTTKSDEVSGNSTLRAQTPAESWRKSSRNAGIPSAVSQQASQDEASQFVEHSFVIPQAGTPQADENRLVPATTWEQDYSRHIDDVLTGGATRYAGENVGEWWHRNTEQFVQQNLTLVYVRPKQLNAAAQQFMLDHTLPPEQLYPIDVYDQNPISVASSQPMTTASPTEDQNSDLPDAQTPGKDKLRTDIRNIRPSLSYAMRNIAEDQLPDGFHEKLENGEYLARQSSPAVLQWAPTNLYHYPLYFEDPSLERYGHTYHPVVQPFASAGRFATQLVGLPYQMTLHPVHAHEYTLGYYRPGECAPKKHYQIPFNEEAAIVQGAAVAGFFLLLP